jgi:hypothetical protein
VGLKRGPLSFVSINEELLERKVAAPAYKTDINGHGGSTELTTPHTPLSTKVGIKFRQQVVVGQSVEFACGLKATEFVCFVYGAGVQPNLLLQRLFIGIMYQPWMIDGDDCGAVSGMNEWQWKPKYSEETCPCAAASTTDPT